MPTPAPAPTKSLAELQEDRNQLATKIGELRDKFTANGNSWAAPEDRDAFEAVNADYDAVTEQMETIRNAESVNRRADEVAQRQQETEERRGAPGREDQRSRTSPGREEQEEQRSLAFGGWFARQAGLPVSERQQQAADAVGFDLQRKELRINLHATQDQRNFRRQYLSDQRHQLAGYESRALSAFDVAAGGAAVPTSFVNTYEKALLDFSGILQVADRIRTANGNEINWPGVNDTGNEGGIVGENKAVSTTAEPAFESIKWGSYEFTSNAVLIPTTLIRDAAFDLATLLAELLGERISRAANNKMTVGTGAKMPKGVVTASALGVTAASATAIASDEIISLEYSVDQAYREAGAYMANDMIIKAIRLLKDGNGNYLWRTSFLEGQPDTILGRAIHSNAHMASAIATTNKTLLFGDFSKYKVREVGTVRMYRLEERYRESDQDAFLAFAGMDGNLLAVGGAASAPIKHLQQA